MISTCTALCNTMSIAGRLGSRPDPLSWVESGHAKLVGKLVSGFYTFVSYCRRVS